MWTIKICGISSADDYWMVRHAGADAVGLNFYSGSRRFVTPEEARRWLPPLGDGCLHVGVFVNQEVEKILRTVEIVGLDAVQLHGDEPVAWIEQLAPLPVIRAIRRYPYETLAEACRRAFPQGPPPSNVKAVLVDSATTGFYGGTGVAGPWQNLGRMPEEWPSVAWILAGGLRPENVYRAILEARPDGVDVASGVERTPRQKDERLVRTFIEAARQAWHELRR